MESRPESACYEHVVISIDVGIVNLGVAIIGVGKWDPKAHGSLDCTGAKAYKEACFRAFLQHRDGVGPAFRVLHSETMAMEMGEPKASGSKAVQCARATHAAVGKILEKYRALATTAPLVIAVEHQMHTNTAMAIVQGQLLVLFLAAMPECTLLVKGANLKMKVCSAVLGIEIPKGKYARNKRASVDTCRTMGLIGPESGDKLDDRCDAILQGVHVAWDLTAPTLRVPRRKTGKKRDFTCVKTE